MAFSDGLNAQKPEERKSCVGLDLSDPQLARDLFWALVKLYL